MTAIIRFPHSVYAGGQQFSERLQTPSRLTQSLLLKRLAMLLQSGLPIGTSLRILADTKHSSGVQSKLQHVVELVEAGVPLSRALEQEAYHLGSFAYTVIRIGETLGTLPENLTYVSVTLKAKHDLRKQILQALIYPVIIILATVAISVFLVVVIFPKIIPIFQSVHSTLPWSTRVLMAISYGLSHHGVTIIGVLVLFTILMVWIQRFKSVKHFFARVIVGVPVIGRLVSSYQIAIGCRTLGILLASDVRFIQALSIVTDSAEQVVYAEAWQEITVAVQSGQRLSAGLQTYPHLFTPVVVQMVEAGEATGNLSEILQYLADMYEGEVRDMTKSLTTLLEPVLMLVMGLVVGFIAVSIITPIYGITQHLHS